MDALRRRLCVGVLAVSVLLCAAGAASADLTGGASAAGEAVLKRGDRGAAVQQVQGALGITVDGVFGSLTERAVKRFQREKGLLADGIVGPQTRQALGLDPLAGSPAEGSSLRLPRALLRIAECESGGNPVMISPGGRYRGKYQFSRATWRALGGQGDPADAPEWVQDRLALKLYRRSGATAWPNCG
jgi:peptidoglycan hydrolase-like protein with peptidoglycan-binding domain